MLRTAAALLALVTASAFAAETVRTEAAGLRFTVPKTWTRVPAPSDFRAAQFQLPRAAGDTADAELVLFFFGSGKGGSAQDNLERWYGQFTKPDGRAAKDVAVVTMRTVNGLHLTAVDLAGTYVAPAMAGGGKVGASGFRMLAAVVEGEGGPWFFKALGPEATIGAVKADFDALLASLEAHH